MLYNTLKMTPHSAGVSLQDRQCDGNQKNKLEIEFSVTVVSTNVMFVLCRFLHGLSLSGKRFHSLS